MLLLHRRLPRAQVLAGITAALQAGSVSADVVAIEARKAAAAPASAVDSTTPARSEEPTVPRRSPARLVTLLARRNAQQLPTDTRPVSSVADYDQLLNATTTGSGRRA